MKSGLLFRVKTTEARYIHAFKVFIKNTKTKCQKFFRRFLRLLTQSPARGMFRLCKFNKSIYLLSVEHDAQCDRCTFWAKESTIWSLYVRPLYLYRGSQYKGAMSL